VLFNDLNFVFVFLPITLLSVLWLCPVKFRSTILIIASLLFYGQSGKEHAFVLILCVLWVYALMDRDWVRIDHRLLLSLAISGPLCALIYFKYSSFILADVLQFELSKPRDGFSLFDDIILPAGISFFTFQLIAYAIDRYRGVIERPIGLQTLLLFISFFPQLIAGPIVRFKQVSDAITALPRFQISVDVAVSAILYITVGLAFKVLIADSISFFVSPMINSPETLGIIGLASLVYSYTFQIYFDFYAYSLCAIGLGKLFGFSLPDNFRRPYSSLNPREFWRRWHVSLSYWIRDYLYYPLGGNASYVRNICIVFVACGFWHGAGYSFLLWGGYHALLVIAYHLFRERWDKMPWLIQWWLNFSLVSVGWLLFIFDFKTLTVALWSIASVPFGATYPSANLIFTVLVAATICFFVRIEKIADAMSSIRLSITQSILYGTALSILAFAAMIFFNRSETFIYFRF